jgi:hypothetical protein
MTRAVLIDLGDVLSEVPGFAEAWSSRLRITPQEFLRAVYEGSDQQVLGS